MSRAGLTIMDSDQAEKSGSRHALPEGSFAPLDPHLTRTVANHESGTIRLLIASAPRGSGYEPMPWA
jgi:hypothetical protein